MALRPAVVAFDVIETLFSIEPVRERLVQAGLPPMSLELWFVRLLRDAFALTALGVYQPFQKVAASSLEPVLAAAGIEPDEQTTQLILGGFSELKPHPDVAPAMKSLRDAGVRIVTLSNGSADATRRLLERAGLVDAIERVISVDEVRQWKPHPAPYRHAAEVSGVPASRLALVAVHSWDIAGARQAGLVTGWASRLERRFPPAFGGADVAGDTLVEVVNGLLRLPSSTD